MSLETKIDELIGALNANTEAHGGKAGKAAAGKPAGKPAAADKVTAEMVKAAVLGIRDSFSKPIALALIKKHAKASEIAMIKPAYYAAVMEACEEKMAEAGGDSDDATDDDDNL